MGSSPVSKKMVAAGSSKAKEPREETDGGLMDQYETQEQYEKLMGDDCCEDEL